MSTINAVGNGLTSATGTGNFVGSTSPTITTPVIAQINDASGNAELAFSSVASAVNYLNITNGSTTNGPSLHATGSDTNISMGFYTKGTGVNAFITTNTIGLYIASGTASQHVSTFNFPNTAGTIAYTFPDAAGTMLMTGVAINSVPSITFSSTSEIIGTTTNNDAAAGSVGEFITSNVGVTNTNLTSGTIADTTTISLTAGDWDIFGTVGFFGGASTLPTLLKGWISTTSVSDPGAPNYSSTFPTGTPFATAPLDFNVPFLRVSIASTTTVYLSVQALFTVSTCTAGGVISARRVR